MHTPVPGRRLVSKQSLPVCHIRLVTDMKVNQNCCCMQFDHGQYTTGQCVLLAMVVLGITLAAPGALGGTVIAWLCSLSDGLIL